MRKPTIPKAKSRFWIWTKRVLITLGLLIAIFIFVVVPYFFSYIITHARTRPFELKLTDTPATYDVPFRDVRFPAPLHSFDRPAHTNGTTAAGEVSDRVMISGWYLPHDSAKAVIVYAHGLFRSRQEMLARACALRKSGYAGLLIDLRRHGKSPGPLSSMGYLERLDVISAVRFVRDSLKLDLPIVASGVSMGAVATLLAAAETPEIDAVIAESSFLSFAHTIKHHARLFLKIPSFPLANTVIFFTKWRIGFSDAAFDLRNAVQKLGNRPILFLAGERDRRMPLEIEKQLYAASSSTRKKLVVVPEATHGAAYRTHPELYLQTVRDFLAAEITPARQTQ